MRVFYGLLSCVLFVAVIEGSRSNGRKLKGNNPTSLSSAVPINTTPQLPAAETTTTTTTSAERHSRKHRRLGMDDAVVPSSAAAATVENTPTESVRRRSSFAEINGTGCAVVLCAANQLCVSKPPTYRAVCIHNKLVRGHSRVARGRGKMRDLDKKPSPPTVQPVRNFHDRVKQAKDQASEYESQREKKQQKRLQSMIVSPKSDISSDSGSQNDVTAKTHAECRRKDLDVVGELLLDTFKQQQDEHHKKHKKEKRNSTKKELHEDDECICQAPVNWEFQQLDVNSDSKLSARETSSLSKSGAVNVSANCLDVFFSACDHNKDAALSEKEWCCCFADVLPPCLAAQNMVPSILVHGQPSVMPGAFVPQCDDDGFYHSTQCDANSGQCWCVDRSGHRINGTSTSGSLNCYEGFTSYEALNTWKLPSLATVGSVTGILPLHIGDV